jgi:hypothetical protein
MAVLLGEAGAKGWLRGVAWEGEVLIATAAPLSDAVG